MDSVDVSEQFGASLFERVRSIIVTVLHGDVIRLFERDAGKDIDWAKTTRGHRPLVDGREGGIA